jgi:AcrR family transcriptional regulator
MADTAASRQSLDERSETNKWMSTVSSLATHRPSPANGSEVNLIAIDSRTRGIPGSELRLERAALELFLASGYESVTVEHIATAAGLSSRTFFRHFPSKADVFAASARRHYGAVCDEMERRPRFESTFTALCESFIKGAQFDPHEAEIEEIRRKLLAKQPELVEKLRADADPMGDRLTVIVAQRLGLNPAVDMTADLIVRLVRSAARSAQNIWLARKGRTRGIDQADLIGLMSEAFTLIAGASVLQRATELERTQAREGLG